MARPARFEKVSPTLEESINSFLHFCESKNLSPKTISFYQGKLKVFINANPDIKMPGEITAEIVRNFLTKELKIKSETSVRHYYVSLQSLFSYLIEDGIVDESPLIYVTKPKVREVPIEPLTVEEVERALSTFDSKTFIGIRNRLAVLILFDCGLRIGELCRLQLQDINLQENTMLIRKSKTGKSRTIPFGEATRRELLRYLGRRSNCEEDTLFVTELGDPATPDRWDHVFGKLAKDSGIARLHAHLFRHSCAVNMLKNGADAFTVQKMLGHANISTTQIYVQLSNTDLQKAHRMYSPADRLSPKITNGGRKKIK